eukprot:1982163-Rhodomonas_salina.1
MVISPLPVAHATAVPTGASLTSYTTTGAAGLSNAGARFQLDAAGFPRPVSLAALGGQEADLLAAQSRDPLTSGGAPLGVPCLSAAIGRTMVQPSEAVEGS